MKMKKFLNVRLSFLAIISAIVYPKIAFAGQDVVDQFLYTLGPLILMAIVFFVMIKMRKGSYGNYMKRQSEHMDKVEKLLERIASAIEKDRK